MLVSLPASGSAQVLVGMYEYPSRKVRIFYATNSLYNTTIPVYILWWIEGEVSEGERRVERRGRGKA